MSVFKTPSCHNKEYTKSPDYRNCSNYCDKKEEDEEEESSNDCAPHACNKTIVAGQKDKATEIAVKACGCPTALTLAGLKVSLLFRHV